MGEGRGPSLVAFTVRNEERAAAGAGVGGSGWDSHGRITCRIREMSHGRAPL